MADSIDLEEEAKKPEGKSVGADGDSGDASNDDEPGPGWMPAIMAGMLILGMIFFIGCSVMTWLLFQQRTELAIRTMRGTYMPNIEQSLIAPEEKQKTLNSLEEFAKDMERGKYEDWQSAGVMTRLIRIPVMQWGDLQAVEAFVKYNANSFPDDASKQFSRLRWGVEMDRVTAIDFDYVLEMVSEYDASIGGNALIKPLQKEKIATVVARCKEVADRLKIEDKAFDRVYIDDVVNREIKAGIAEGTL